MSPLTSAVHINLMEICSKGVLNLMALRLDSGDVEVVLLGRCSRCGVDLEVF